MISKTLLRVLGLSLIAALGLMAFGASSTSAEDLTLGSLIKGKALVSGSQVLATNAPFAGTFGLIQILVVAIDIEIHCEKGTVTEGKILNGPTGEALAVILFEKCKVYEWNGTMLGGELPCFISNGGANRHITFKTVLLVVTHRDVGGVTRLHILAEPDPVGTMFAEVKYEAGMGCPLLLTQKIQGTNVFDVTQPHQITQTLTSGLEGLQKLFGAGMVYGINAATLHSQGSLALTGVAHTGLTWGFI